ncbi:MAG: putative bifunctional diguanylate cyclase/phosphodiesterase [Cellulomonas sp.]
MAAWLRYLVVGVLVAAVDLALPEGILRDGLFCAVAGSGAVAIAVGVRRHRPAHPRAWLLIAVGIACWVSGGAIFAWSVRNGLPAPSPSIADAFSLALYPLVAVGVGIFVRSRGAERHGTALLDSVILTVAVGLLSWVFLVEPSWSSGQMSTLGKFVSAAYPIGNVVLFGGLVRLAMAPGAGRTVSRVGAGIAGASIAAMSLLQATGAGGMIEVHPAVLDPRWLVGYVLAGAASLHPSMATMTEPASVRSDPVHGGHLRGLAAALLVGPLILAGELLAGAPLNAWPVVVASVVIVGFVQVRMVRLVRHMHEQATTDELTGLPNRRALYLDAQSRFADPCDRRALLMLDLDRFKEVNDSLGHHVGDQLLVQVGARIAKLMQPGALLVRLGGDEFAIVLDDAGRDEAIAVAAALRIALAIPFTVAGQSVHGAVSIGVALFPDDGADLTTLLRKADIAMYKAKASGEVHLYNDAHDDGTGRRLMVEELDTALVSQQLVLHYQPKMDLRTGEVNSVEALVRWAHPTRGLLYPDKFLDLVEESGLMRAMTRVVLQIALDQAALWLAAGRPLIVAVNLSASSLVDVDLPDEVVSMLTARALPPNLLQLEITEEFLMADRDQARVILTQLRDSGIEIAVDDFGTGYSSLAYLRDLPIDELKLDRSFIFPMSDDARAAALVASTIALAHSLDLRMVAEGVETAEVLADLARLGCDQAQGYYLSKPLPAAQLDTWFHREANKPCPVSGGSAAHPNIGIRTPAFSSDRVPGRRPGPPGGEGLVQPHRPF